MTERVDRPTADEARAFARAFRSFLGWIHEDRGEAAGNPVVALVREHLGERAELSVLGNELPAFEQVNLQVALDHWMLAEGRTTAVHGVAIPPHHEVPSLQQLVHGHGSGPLRLSAPDLVDLPSGPDRTTACLRRALLLVEDTRGRYVLMVRGPEPHQEPVLALDVAGLPTAAAQDVLREVAELRHRLNVYRGQVLELGRGPSGVTVVFPTLAPTSREDVVLPEQTLRRIERHTLDTVTHRDALRSAGQHLKRGLLLFGPPGTGKTHTTRYLVHRLTGATRLLLSGESLHAVGMVAQMARDLQPAVLVLEDVDLVAEDRGYGPGPSPVLFALLDAMDGAAADADLLFLLTTNRADLLEPALAARPGRVDVAVEIAIPDADARRRLLDLYTRGVPLALSDVQLDDLILRTEGVTASFVKELVRRSVLEALTTGREVGEPLTADVVARALDDLLDSGQSVTRALLGAGPPGSVGGRAAIGHRGADWLIDAPATPSTAYGSTLWITTDE